ncbi:MAG: hypothetical protein AAGI52_01980 [Bacteroidota bacterium]
MTRSTLFSFGLVTLVALSGCSVVEAQRYPTPHRGGEVYRPVDHRSERYDRRADRRGIDRRVRRDVRQYVRFLDRELRLSGRQEFRITEILENRAFRHLNRHDYRRAYPFPREFRRERRNRAVARFWDDADWRIERVLNRRQTREYRFITDGRGRHRYRNDRYERFERYDRDERFRDRDDRYDDDRRRDRRDDRRRDRD